MSFTERHQQPAGPGNGNGNGSQQQRQAGGDGLPRNGPVRSVTVNGFNSGTGRFKMVYEEDLRRACLGRQLDEAGQKEWVELRKGLPINRWTDRSRIRQGGKTAVEELIASVESYLRVFFEESRKRSLRLDMTRNYYSAAVDLLGRYEQGRPLPEDVRQKLTSLMILVDYKDARLAMQILHSIV